MAIAGDFCEASRGGHARDEAGFALLVALVTLIGVSLLAAAGYLLSRADYRINQSHRAATQAFYVADAGLQRYLGSGRIWPDTVSYAHPQGRAAVWATKVVEVDTITSLYRLEARGFHSPPEGGAAVRTVSTVAILRAPSFGLNAAFTSPPGLQKNGVAGLVSGFDAANPADCGLSGPHDKAGLAVPPGELSLSGGGKGKGGGGDPPGFEGDPAVDESMSALEMLEATGIDWAALKSGGYAEADYVYSEDGWPDFSSQVGPDEWPMIVGDQDAFAVNPDQSGRGTLVVYGDLDINGSWSWDGIVLVGGTLTSNGNNHVEGAVVGGINMLLGETVDENQLGNGTWEYRYHSCNVINALKGIGAPVEEPGTWSETIS